MNKKGRKQLQENKRRTDLVEIKNLKEFVTIILRQCAVAGSRLVVVESKRKIIVVS